MDINNCEDKQFIRFPYSTQCPCFLCSGGRRGRDRMVVGFITTYIYIQSVPITTNL